METYVRLVDVRNAALLSMSVFDFQQRLEKIPTIDYETAHWVLEDLGGETVWACSKCHYPASYKWSEPKDKFCRNCGRPIERKD